MLDSQELVIQLKNNTKNFINTLSKTNDDIFNTRPAENSWSIAEVAEHITILDSFILNIINGETYFPEPSRKNKTEEIRTIFSNRKNKLSAPEIIQPTQHFKSFTEITKAIQEKRELLINVIENSDVYEICTRFKYYSLGELSKIEWCYLTIYHTERHMYQIKDIQDTLK